MDTYQANVLSTGRYLPAMGDIHAKVMNRMYRRVQESANARFCLDDFDASHFSSWFKPDGGFVLRK